jgi:hypothetical protein
MTTPPEKNPEVERNVAEIEKWQIKARATGTTITPTPDYIFFPNVQVTVFTAHELDTLINEIVITYGEAKKAEGAREERAHLVERIEGLKKRVHIPPDYQNENPIFLKLLEQEEIKNGIRMQALDQAIDIVAFGHLVGKNK